MAAYVLVHGGWDGGWSWRDVARHLQAVGPEIMGFMEQTAASYGDGWRVPHNPPDADRQTDFMLKAGQQSLRISNPESRQIKRTFVQFTDKADDDFMQPIMEETAVRVQEAGWTCLEMPFEHWPFLDKPQEAATLLLELGGH